MKNAEREIKCVEMKTIAIDKKLNAGKKKQEKRERLNKQQRL